jgi:hypothetical protein
MGSDKMSNKWTGLVRVAVVALIAGTVSTAVSAQDWRRGEYEYFKGPHQFGPLCEYRIGAHGSAPWKLFGSAKEVRKAELRSIGDWEFEAARLFGPRYGHWDLAADKRVHCDVRGLEFVCSAVAYPCRPR